MDRNYLKEVFNDTMRWIGEEPALTEAVISSVEGTRLYLSDEYPDLRDDTGAFDTVVNVSGYRTFEAAMSLRKAYPEARIAVHNFASATNPGGGVKSGSTAQEESLCRCSTLYPVLKTEYLKQQYYMPHRALHDIRYTDSCIYSPDICIIKTDNAKPERMPGRQWVKADVITCAAPNLSGRDYDAAGPEDKRKSSVSDDELYGIHIRRARHMLTAAAAQGAEILVLGAFGCGAFRNDPKIVAAAYKKVLPEFYGRFRRIEFAVYRQASGKSRNYSVFKSILG